jgi:hypothetical protein
MQSVSQNRPSVSKSAAGALVAGVLGGITLTILGQYLSSLRLQHKTSRITRMNTIRSFFDSYSELSPQALLEHIAPVFTHQVLPSSLSMPARNREAFATHAKGITSIFKTFAMVPQVVYDDCVRNVVIAHCKMIGELHELGHWENECVMWLQMSRDGMKIVEMKEFVDSAKARILKEKLTAMMEAKQADSIFHE